MARTAPYTPSPGRAFVLAYDPPEASPSHPGGAWIPEAGGGRLNFDLTERVAARADGVTEFSSTIPRQPTLYAYKDAVAAGTRIPPVDKAPASPGRVDLGPRFRGPAEAGQ